MRIIKTKTFQSGNSEAIRLPKEVAFGIGTEVVIETSGETLRIYRAPKISNQELVAQLRAMPKPSAIERRDTDEIPKPAGL
ncbi:MAG TPA: AbrB/MazE/SpoVT family DNA-binding domain-containing protein [Xanthomonadales bacterium]|nr:AbrB/MazE/SpoVT family DNA-binding domain-containing protein [Xanthomonadales bacterium]